MSEHAWYVRCPPLHHDLYAERDFHHPPQSMVPVILVLWHSTALVFYNSYVSISMKPFESLLLETAVSFCLDVQCNCLQKLCKCDILDLIT